MMSTARFDKKHDDIVKAAFKIFLRNGYVATSMDAVAQQAKVSKATVYNHFDDKLDLFKHVMVWHSQQLIASNQFQQHLAHGSLKERLRSFAHALIRALLDPRSLAFVRVIIFETAHFPELGKAIWQDNKMPLLVEFCAFLEAEHKAKRLVVKNTTLASRQFFGLLKENLVWPLLLGLTVDRSPQAIDEVVDNAVKMFLIMYRA